MLASEKCVCRFSDMSTVVVAVSVLCDIHTQQIIIPIATTEPDVQVHWVMLYTIIGKILKSLFKK